MRLDEGTLRAFLDGELSPEEHRNAQALLAASTEAQAELARLKAERHDFAHLLDDLAPTPAELSSPGRAWRRFPVHSGLRLPAANSSSLVTERLENMVNKPVFVRFRSAIVATAVVALAAGSLSFAPVRALAGDFLRLFRMEQVQVVEVDKERLDALEDDPRFQGVMDQLQPQLAEIEDKEPTTVDSTQAASDMAGFSVAELGNLPDDVGVRTNIDVYDQMVAHVDLDRRLLRELFAAADIEVDLPQALDEEPLVVTQPATVVQDWRQGDVRTLQFFQMGVPQIDGPEGLDVAALGVAGLQLLGLTEDEAREFGSKIDWASTMVLPIPKDARYQVSKISVDGANGFLFVYPEEDEDKRRDNVLLWTDDGLSYMIKGDYSGEQLLGIALTIK